jgi:hypothetical protein
MSLLNKYTSQMSTKLGSLISRKARLPLLTLTPQRIRTQTEAGHLPEDETKAVSYHQEHFRASTGHTDFVVEDPPTQWCVEAGIGFEGVEESGHGRKVTTGIEEDPSNLERRTAKCRLGSKYQLN